MGEPPGLIIWLLCARKLSVSRAFWEEKAHYKCSTRRILQTSAVTTELSAWEVFILGNGGRPVFEREPDPLFANRARRKNFSLQQRGLVRLTVTVMVDTVHS